MKKRIVSNQSFWTFVLVALMSFSACGPNIVFHEPQPEDSPVLTSFPEAFQGKWDNPEEQSYILITQGEIFSFERSSMAIPIDSLNQRGFLLREDSLFQIQVYEGASAEEQDSLMRASKTFVGLLGDTLLKEPDPEEKIEFMHYASGPKPFVHHDSTMLYLKDDSLHIMRSGVERICQIYEDVVVKFSEGYLFLNSPIPKWDAWVSYVVQITADQRIRYTTFHDKIEVAREYFELSDPIDPNEEDPHYFASPTAEQLMQFIASDSLEWEVVGRK